MIIIVDSGSTKSDWALVEQSETIARLTTQGTNPFFQSEKQISDIIREELLPQISNRRASAIYFYGAGCAFDAQIKILERVLGKLFPEAKIEVGSDLLAAARALCGREAGIACILGTGSNSCHYDGEKIIANVSPLGFMLGDEGSGAVLGRALVGDYLKKQMPKELAEEFAKDYPLSQPQIMERVYKQPMPNRFLASFTPFLAKHIDSEYASNLVESGFTSFLKRNTMQYSDVLNLPIHFTGSIAFHFEQSLKRCVERAGMRMGTIRKAPMEGLIEYHKR